MPSSHYGTPFVVMAERVIAIRGHEQVVVPVPEGHRRTQSILSQKANLLLSRWSERGRDGYCQWNFDAPEAARAWKVDGLAESTIVGAVQSALVSTDAFEVTAPARRLPYRVMGGADDVSQARDDSSARSRTAPTPKLRDTDDIVPEQDDPFASATDLTETEIGDAHTLVTLSPTTGSIFKAEEPTGSISDPTDRQDIISARTTAILPAPQSDEGRSETVRLGSLVEDGLAETGTAILGTQNEETVEVGYVDFDAPSPTTSTAGYIDHTGSVGLQSPDGDSSKALERTEYEGLQASRNDSETRQDSQHTARSTDQSPDDGTNKGDALDPTASNEGNGHQKAVHADHEVPPTEEPESDAQEECTK